MSGRIRGRSQKLKRTTSRAHSRSAAPKPTRSTAQQQAQQHRLRCRATVRCWDPPRSLTRPAREARARPVFHVARARQQANSSLPRRPTLRARHPTCRAVTGSVRSELCHSPVALAYLVFSSSSCLCPSRRPVQGGRGSRLPIILAPQARFLYGPISEPMTTSFLSAP